MWPKTWEHLTLELNTELVWDPREIFADCASDQVTTISQKSCGQDEVDEQVTTVAV